MAVKIRLQRFGGKKKPFYRIVAADSRNKRDGRFLEVIGTYNPLTEPASVKIDEEKALKWLSEGAQPTDTVKNLFVKAGIKKNKLSGDIMAVNYEALVKHLIEPLVVHPEDLMVKIFSEDEERITLQVIVNKDDLGRVIGKNGRIANAIRTIAYASASREGRKITINIDSF